MNTIILLLSLTFAVDSFSQQQPAPAVRPTRPQNRTMSAPSDTSGVRKRGRKLNPDSLRRGGATRIDSVRRR
ncbi:hypothetical protein [Fibrivirga algicola]|uniref:Uncharacterized protein n=1 Tax=Fibrivirga algicola TaxID=2950420 RepID=A0ABX0QC21_9BACT|nr:hypothetical protein [Fibrivirga algicola]ARK10832.1 hypothetical protein A6C57_11135 [Fibrella sp. ES10-3-2-2]NID09926.1 hypothetical protein [Fibrivirga algicola]